MEACWIRPRYTGYLTFQAKAGELIEAHLRGDFSGDALLSELERLHAALTARRRIRSGPAGARAGWPRRMTLTIRYSRLALHQPLLGRHDAQGRDAAAGSDR